MVVGLSGCEGEESFRVWILRFEVAALEDLGRTSALMVVGVMTSLNSMPDDLSDMLMAFIVFEIDVGQNVRLTLEY